MRKKLKHTAVYTPAGDAGWWTAQIEDVPGAISQGRGIAQARERIREALALVLDVDEDRLELVDDVRLPAAVQRRVDAYRKKRDEAEAEAKAASALSRAAVRAVIEAGYSTRDAGEALGLSQTRVAQLAGE